MIIGIDMSTTNTGVSVFNPKTNKIIHYELISPKDKNFMIRCIKIVNRIIEICKEHKPSRVQFEDVQMRFNRAGYTLSFDLIGRGVEWLTGGQRINDYDTLVKAAKSRDIDLKKSELYLQAFRFGMPPEGGFSFGSERITMHILGLANVREASLFPRDMERIDERLSKEKEDKKK